VTGKHARPGHRRPQHRRKPARAGGNSLTRQASRALGWSFGSTFLNKVSLFGVGIMLARLLGPHAFGTYAVAYVALIGLLAFNELGVSLAIVRWPGDPGEIIPTVTTISAGVSAIIYAGCFFAAPAYAGAMGAPGATTVIRVLALAVLTDGCTSTPVAILQRNFRQGQRTIADQVNVWLGTIVTVALAWSGDGAMSLAVGRLVGSVAGAILLLAFAPESLRLGFDRAKARALLRFGLPLAGASLVAFAVATVDQVIVGHLLGTVALGFYVLALNVANWPITMFSQPVRTVGPAVFARLQHDSAAMRTTFLSAAGLLCAAALPACLLIGGAARPLVSLVYGSRWIPAAQPLMWLALLGGVQVFFLLVYDYFVVLARSRFLLSTQLVWLIALVPALILGARADGIAGASLAETAVAALCILPWYLLELAKSGIRPGALGRHLWLPVTGAVVTGLIAAGAAAITAAEFLALAVSGTVAVAVAGALIYRMRASVSLIRSTSAAAVAAPGGDSVPVASS
jgi:O-antigen/teichoic acid export membrane protein